MTTETLRCRCGIEVRIVRLTPRITALGHVENPRQNSHPVTLSRSADDVSRMGCVGSRPLNRVREDASTQRTNGKRPASDGLIPDRTRRSGRSSSGIVPSRQRSGGAAGSPSAAPAAPLGLGAHSRRG